MKVLAISFLFLAVACASAPERSSEIGRQPYPSVQPSKLPPSTLQEEQDQVDQVALQRWLGMDRDVSDLGYAEKAFNTCEAGFGYSRNHNCRERHLVVIHFRLQCRDSEGTVSKALTADDIKDIGGTNVKWSLKNQSGHSRTNGEGFGQIRGLFTKSQRYQRLRLGVGGELLYVRAGEINTIVTPGSWCRF